jgi:hypothetical protein
MRCPESSGQAIGSVELAGIKRPGQRRGLVLQWREILLEACAAADPALPLQLALQGLSDDIGGSPAGGLAQLADQPINLGAFDVDRHSTTKV